LFVSQVRVFNFRNLADQSVNLSNGPIYITGLNGNGKTNFIEAIYLLSGSRSFRTNVSNELSRWGESQCSVFGVVTTALGTEELGISLTPGRREAFSNGDPLGSISELLGRLCIVAFSPADLMLIKGSPSGRRRFLDRHMVDLQPNFLKTLMTYQRALASKSALLKQGYVDYQQLLPWNTLLAEYGGKVVENRSKFLKSLCEKSSVIHSSYANMDGQLGLELESDLLDPSGEVNQDYIAHQFERAAQREIATRSPVVGVQRDDIKVTLGGVDGRAYASQGQTRSIVLSLKLGVIDLLDEVKGESPVVLLDDVDSELDQARSERLFKTLLEKPRQLIVTGTATPPKPLDGDPSLQILKMEKGLVSVDKEGKTES
jgi:DNA replication and repair protein RecF